MVDFVFLASFIALLFLTSLWSWGVHAFFELTGIELWFRGVDSIPPIIPLPEWIRKPLFECPPCMSSLHGTIAFFIIGDFSIYFWPVFCFCLCGLNYIIKEHLYAKVD
jgi:hypothetical protein